MLSRSLLWAFFLVAPFKSCSGYHTIHRCCDPLLSSDFMPCLFLMSLNILLHYFQWLSLYHNIVYLVITQTFVSFPHFRYN